MVRRFENGKMIVNHNKFMGYTKNENGDLVIVQEEAEIVRLIFRLYLEGYSAKKDKPVPRGEWHKNSNRAG